MIRPICAIRVIRSLLPGFGTRKKSKQTDLNRRMNSIFVSHDHGDADLSIEITELIEKVFGNKIRVFCSSRKKDQKYIPADYLYNDNSINLLAEYLTKAILGANTYIFIRTRRSTRHESCIVNTELSYIDDCVAKRHRNGEDHAPGSAIITLLAHGTKKYHLPHPLNIFPVIKLKKVKKGSATIGVPELILKLTLRHRIEPSYFANWHLNTIGEKKEGQGIIKIIEHLFE